MHISGVAQPTHSPELLVYILLQNSLKDFFNNVDLRKYLGLKHPSSLTLFEEEKQQMNNFKKRI